MVSKVNFLYPHRENFTQDPITPTPLDFPFLILSSALNIVKNRGEVDLQTPQEF